MRNLRHDITRAGALRFRNQCWKDGKFITAALGKRFETANPGTGTVMADLARGWAENIDHAIIAARASFEDGRWAR